MVPKGETPKQYHYNMLIYKRFLPIIDTLGLCDFQALLYQKQYQNRTGFTIEIELRLLDIYY